MPPQLTEAWGAAYIHILIILFVFVIGIPALLFHVTIPVRVQYIIRRYSVMAQWYIFTSAFVLLLIFLCFIWFLHPCSGNFASEFESWLASGLMTGAIVLAILLFLTVLLWWNLVRFIRKRVIYDLGRNLERSFQKKGVLVEKYLEDLIYLGEVGESEYEKKLVLHILNSLTDQVQNSNEYSGRELEHLLRNIDKFIGSLSKEKTGIEDNLQSAVNKLGDVLHKSRRHNLASSLDANLTLMIIRRLGMTSVEMKYDSTALMILQIAEISDDVLLYIGLLALTSKRFFIATSALNKLEALTERVLPITPERSVNLLGLIAHFWYAGDSTRMRAESFLIENRSNFSPSLANCLKRAIKYHYDLAQFDTADKLRLLLNDLTNRISA